MKFNIYGMEYDLKDAAQYIEENIDESYYDEMLDECYGDIEIGGLSYSASIALYRVDEVAYRCRFSDFADSLRDDIIDSLENMTQDEKIDIYGVEVTCIEEFEHDEDGYIIF